MRIYYVRREGEQNKLCARGEGEPRNKASNVSNTSGLHFLLFSKKQGDELMTPFMHWQNKSSQHIPVAKLCGDDSEPQLNPRNFMSVPFSLSF